MCLLFLLEHCSLHHAYPSFKDAFNLQLDLTILAASPKLLNTKLTPGDAAAFKVLLSRHYNRRLYGMSANTMILTQYGFERDLDK